MAYTIKKVEKETKISAHTLRFWAKNCISLRVDFILRANLGNNIFIFFNNIFKL